MHSATLMNWQEVLSQKRGALRQEARRKRRADLPSKAAIRFCLWQDIYGFMEYTCIYMLFKTTVRHGITNPSGGRTFELP